MRSMKQVLALLGQLEAAGVAVKQFHGQTVFQGRNLAADRRLTQVQDLAGMSKAASFGNGVKTRSLSQSILYLPQTPGGRVRALGSPH